MRLFRLSLAALAAAAVLQAQSPLSLPFNSNNGLGANSQIFFDLNVTDPAGITITSLDVNTSSVVGTAGTIDLFTTPTTYVGNQQLPANWTLGGSGPATSAGDNNPTGVCLGAGVFLAQGSYGIAIRHNNLALDYTNSTGTVTVTRAEVTFSGGQSQGSFFASAPINNRIFNGNIYYNVGNVPGSVCASKSTFGTGCYNIATDSVYQLFADAAAASAGLQGQSVQFTPAGGGYVVSWGGGAYIAPTGAAVNVFATASDDAEAVVTPSIALPTAQGPQASVRVHSNGVLSWGGAAQTFPGTNSYTPTVAGFLNAANAGIWAWHDYNEFETGSGRIKREEVVVGTDTVLAITWDGVENYSTPAALNPSTMQIQANLTTGVVTIVWVTVDSNTTSTFGSAHLVGYSPAGTSNDPGSINLATALPVATTNGADHFPLTVDSNAPKLGSTWNIVTTNVDAISPVGLLYFGSAPLPGIDLGFIGAPGCNAYQTADIGSVTFPVSGGTGTVPVPVPANPALSGAQLHVQSLAFSLLNTLNLEFSNGLTGTIGS